MGRGAWQATVHGAAKSQTRLSDWAHSLKEIHLWDNTLPEVSNNAQGYYFWSYGNFVNKIESFFMVISYYG